MAILLLAVPAFAQNTPSPAVIWQDRGEAAGVDLSTGPDGKDRGHGTEFTVMKGSNA